VEALLNLSRYLLANSTTILSLNSPWKTPLPIADSASGQ
jgi:hypothetical protein